MVGVPQQLITYDLRNFSPNPMAWRPERWINPEKEEAFRRSAYIPFSYGAFNCAGKALGLLVVRYTLATLVHEFDIAAAPEHDHAAFERSIKEYFSLQKGPFWATITPRSVRD